MPSASIKNNKEYLDSLSKTPTVVLKISTSTCGPCKMMSPVFEKIADENSDDSVSFVSIVADETVELSKLAQSLGITSVPAFIIYKDEKVIDRFVGAFPAAVLKTKLGL